MINTFIIFITPLPLISMLSCQDLPFYQFKEKDPYERSDVDLQYPAEEGKNNNNNSNNSNNSKVNVIQDTNAKSHLSNVTTEKTQISTRRAESSLSSGLDADDARNEGILSLRQKRDKNRKIGNQVVRYC